MNEQYVYTGKYREFRGYVFCNGKPVTIQDRGTLEAIAKEKDFLRYVPPECEAAPIADENACPKCGNVFARGLTMHVRFCRGSE